MATIDVSPSPGPRDDGQPRRRDVSAGGAGLGGGVVASAAPEPDSSSDHARVGATHRRPPTSGDLGDADAVASGAGRRWWLDSRPIAVLTWLVGVGVAFLIVKVAHANPVSVRGAVMPLAMGAFAFAALLVVLRRAWGGRWTEPIIGVLVGTYAAWIALVNKAALYGTAMSYGGMIGDAHRIVAQAEKYMSSWGSTDLFLPNIPSDYPPLYTWLTGRAAQVLGVPAWQLMQNTQALWLSGTVVVVYLLWRRLVSAPLAAVIAMVAFIGNHNPIKPYEVIALAVMVPWVLLTFGNPPRGRLHWLPAGVISGLIFLTYQGYLVFTALGILAIAWWVWRPATRVERRSYLIHLGLVAATGVVVASWYLIPYLIATATNSSSFSSDTYYSATLASDPIPLHFFDATPQGVLQLVGLIGLVVFYTRTWWARPLAAIIVGTGLFYLLAAVRFVLTGHTMFYQYAHGPIAVAMVAAGVLSGAEIAAIIARRGPRELVGRVLVLLTVTMLVSTSVATWRDWMPTTVGNVGYPKVLATGGRAADLAHREALPDLRMSKFSPTGSDPDAVPAYQARDAVAARLGPGFIPTTVSIDERLFSYLPWYNYVAFSPTASPALDRWAEHNAEVLKLRQQKDPAAFAALAAHTAFGPIDVFLLRNSAAAAAGGAPVAPGEGGFVWRSDVVFTADQLSPAYFDRVDLSNGYVLFIRKR